MHPEAFLSCKEGMELLQSKPYQESVQSIIVDEGSLYFRMVRTSTQHLGKEQYYPLDAEAIPENRLFAQFHSPQTNAMKNQILTELSSPLSKLRVVFATVALGMGIDIPCIRHVIHVGPPHTIREYFQETGRAGRDRKQSTAVLYYNKRDIAMSRPGISDSICEYCKLEDSCLRMFLLGCLDVHDVMKDNPHVCCSYCKMQCKCSECTT
ncbi:Hypothetical predicted protein [Paramuricea clavata]|uniref:DNA 3'-5' helicase n=1 Tax=Paramuricea clavata TaxID=317549 RepID=A0A7D9HT94_PARCT|nr:Hypothetical predicted protein [Paramuricea clavata]